MNITFGQQSMPSRPLSASFATRSAPVTNTQPADAVQFAGWKKVKRRGKITLVALVALLAGGALYSHNTEPVNPDTTIQQPATGLDKGLNKAKDAANAVATKAMDAVIRESLNALFSEPIEVVSSDDGELWDNGSFTTSSDMKAGDLYFSVTHAVEGLDSDAPLYHKSLIISQEDGQGGYERIAMIDVVPDENETHYQSGFNDQNEARIDFQRDSISSGLSNMFNVLEEKGDIDLPADVKQRLAKS